MKMKTATAILYAGTVGALLLGTAGCDITSEPRATNGFGLVMADWESLQEIADTGCHDEEATPESVAEYREIAKKYKADQQLIAKDGRKGPIGYPKTAPDVRRVPDWCAMAKRLRKVTS